MSLFIIEAAAVGLKEALKAVAVWYVFWSFLAEKNRPGLMAPFYAGALIVPLISAAAFFFLPPVFARGFISPLTGYVFFVFFAGSIVWLFQSAGLRLLPAIGEGLLRPAVFLLTIAYFAPDAAGSAMFTRGLSEMKEMALPVYLSAGAGLLLPLALLPPALKRLRAQAGRYFDTGQFLLFLSLVKLLGGGIKGFAEFSLIPSVERGVMKFVHDFVHQTFVFLLVPDHPVLRTSAWNFVGIFFGSNFARWVVLILLLAPFFAFILMSLRLPLEVPADSTGAAMRKAGAAIRRNRLRKAVPVLFFILAVSVSWFSGKGREASRLYNPAPKPVVSDKGIVVIPLSDPTMDLMDGRLHKFSLLLEGESVVFIALRKPDGRLAVCLDACEICAPEGYGQTGGNVVCIYCMTPIPVETLGEKGGCNPIPLAASVSERDIRIAEAELALRWRDVKSGKTKEEIRP